MMRWACLLLLLGTACNRGATPRLDPETSVTPGGARPSQSEPPAPSANRAALPRIVRDLGGAPATAEPPPEAGSLRLTAQALVVADPSPEGTELGLLAGGTRLPRRERVTNEACAAGWIPVEPAGFICAETVVDRREPSDVVLPRIPAGALIPGTYGKIRSQDAVFFPNSTAAATGSGGRAVDASLTVRRMGVERVGGRAFWRTRHGLVEASQVRRYRGSRFSGIELEDGLAQPIAWTIGNGDRFSVGVRAKPSRRARVVRRVGLRKSFTVLETSEDGKFVRIDEKAWLPRSLVRIVTSVEKPEGVGEQERWIDVDLDQQTLVAYRGSTAVYATLISSGKVLHRTPTGTFRISRKVAARTMNSMADSKESYSVDQVPWTAYFAKGYALHAAFWHGGFGRTRSHGCVNLAPKDARYLYEWMAPGVAPGWKEIYGNETQPGSVVRIRTAKDPAPEWKGYAAAMLEAGAADVAQG